MSNWHWMLIGAAAAGPVWLLVALWSARRLWRNARRLAARTRGRQRLIELGQLVGGLAHEIKNPLSTINVNLKLLSEDLARKDDEDHRRLSARLETVRTETGRITEILDDFLRFAGKYELTLADVDLRQVIEESVDFFTPQAEASHMLLRSALPDEPLACRIDQNLIKQALLNLMINAVQASESGDELLIRLSRQRREAVIEVIDTGCGMSPGDLQKVFQVYFSTKPRGSGLGLPTTRRIVLAHGGQINVESEPDTGTRFVIKLPLAE